jgi:hypothetical protein
MRLLPANNLEPTPKKKLKEKLVQARLLVQLGWSWRWTYNAKDERVDSKSKDAVKWDIVDAVHAVCDNYEEFRDCLHTLQKKVKEPLSLWNSAKGRTQQEVLELFDKVIK